MKNILGIFNKRLVLSLIGLLAIALIIWFMLPLISIADRAFFESGWVRGVIITLMFLIWGFIQYKKKVNADKANAGIVDGIASQAETAAAEEITELTERFKESLDILKKSKRKKGESYSLYKMPWYIIIGPPGAGKTTALLNSGLEFPLAEQYGDKPLQGIGGTRNCDWWFTDEAVLLDTAGRYVTQDSHAEVDQAAWEGFLGLLKKHRPRRPINGVFVAISLSDLLVQNEHERSMHINAIKQRVDELYNYFDLRIPIYIMLTKCDLVAGFMEYFETLGQEEREQVWGITFPYAEKTSESDSIAHFTQEFDHLIKRLKERQIWRLHQERDIRQRTLIGGFPQQMAALKEPLESFLQSIFSSSRYKAAPLLRGVYFTSGTQEGTPIDRVMGSMARSFGLNQQALPSYGGQNRSYFLTHLLRRVVFPEADLAGVSLRWERYRHWSHLSGYAAALAILVLIPSLWTVSYFKNKNYLGNVAEQAQQAKQTIESLASNDVAPWQSLDALNQIQQLADDIDLEEKNTSWFMHLGLYQGDALKPQANSAYTRTLSNVFLPKLILRLENQLRRNVLNPDYLLFAGLKTYLMFEDPAHFNSEHVIEWFTGDLGENLPRNISPEQRQRLYQHITALVAHGAPRLPHSLDQNLVFQTRRALNQIPKQQLVYNAFKQFYLHKRTVPNFKISDTSSEAVLVFSRRSGKSLNQGIPGFYTYQGFKDVFMKNIEEFSQEFTTANWILSEQSTIAPTTAENEELSINVRKLYLQDYAQHWDDLIGDLQLKPFSNFVQVVQRLSILANPDSSPLIRLLAAVSQETSLNRSLNVGASILEKAAEGVGSIKNKLSRFFRSESAPQDNVIAENKIDMIVEPRFESLNKLVKQNEDGSMAISRLIDMLREFHLYLSAIEGAGNQGAAAVNALSGQSSEVRNMLNKIRTEAQGKHSFLNGLLLSLAGSSQNLLEGGIHTHLNALWRAEPLQLCHRAISNRYPFVRSSAVQVPLKDFGQFFGPGGTMDSFFNTHLKDLVDTTRVPWRLRSAGVSISRRTLAQFRRAKAIKDTFFQAGSQAPTIFFELKPEKMDRSINRLYLELDGQKHTYSHGPVRYSQFQWPGPNGSSQVQLQMLPSTSIGSSSVTKIGPWAWFELLDQAMIEPTKVPEQHKVTFNIGNRKAIYALRATSTRNPFRMAELEKFKCPVKL